MLTVLHSIPEGLLDREPAELAGTLEGPTLLHLVGGREPPLFVSVLLHGNETTGWQAMRRVLRRHLQAPLPRSLSLLVGNVAAAAAHQRRLDDQPDFNRIWNGGRTPWHAMAAGVLEEMRARGVFAAIDIHNNTGRNPHFAVATNLDPATLSLAGCFGRRVVHSVHPDSVLAMAFSRLCPAITAECGQPGHDYGAEHALQLVERCLELEDLSHALGEVPNLELYHAVARVEIPEGVDFGFRDDAAGIRFVGDLDTMNFREVPPGTTFARLAPETSTGLHVWREDGTEAGAEYFAREGDALINTVPLLPSSLTLDERAVRQDCLCYLLERRTLGI